MAIIECNECKHNVSTKALSCPNCGAPVPKNTKKQIKEDYEEVTIKKETTHPLNVLIYIGFFILLIVICLCEISLIKTFRSTYSLTSATAEPTFHLNTSIYSSIIINATFISCLITLISKKSYKLSKIAFIINLITHIVFFRYIYSHNFRIDIQFYILYILNIIYLLLPRFNKLEETTKIVKKDSIEQIELKNKKIEEYHNESIYTKKHKIFLTTLVIISIIILIPITILNKEPIYHETVIQEKTDYQIKIINDYINVREKPTTKSNKLGEVSHSDIYNVLDVIGGENYIWYKIKYQDQIGYVSSDRQEPYVRELYENALIVNIFCDNKNECTNLHNKLIKYKKKNNIFLINYIDITNKQNKKLFNKTIKYFGDKETVPYVIIGTERIHTKNIYKDTIYYINHPVDKEYNIVDIIKKDNELPNLKPQGNGSNDSYIIE